MNNIAVRVYVDLQTSRCRTLGIDCNDFSRRKVMDSTPWLDHELQQGLMPVQQVD